MDTIDEAKAARVWERVRGETAQAPREIGLPELIAKEWEAATTYLQLSRRFQGRQNALLRKLFQQEQTHMTCLKGLYTLITGNKPKVAGVRPMNDEPQRVLRRCYGRQMQCLAQYEQRSSDPECGHIFVRLAEQEREHCRILLELIGSLK